MTQTPPPATSLPHHKLFAYELCLSLVKLVLSLTLIRRGAFALFRDDRGPDSHTARHGPRRFNAGVV